MNKFASAVFAVGLVLCFAHAAAAATYTVTKTADTNDGTCDADCSFREAITAANATTEDDIIAFSSLFSTPQTIVLSGSEISILPNGTLTLNGPGAHLLTIDGNQASRILTVGPRSTATIDAIRFTRGNGVGATNSGRAGAIYNLGSVTTISNCIITGNTAANGGGLNNASALSPTTPSNLTIINTEVSNNTSTSTGGGTQNFAGSTTTIINSTFSGNTSNIGSTGGGAMQGNGIVTISNSTFANNTSNFGGGGISFNGTSLTINNSTFSGNNAPSQGGAIHRTGANPVSIRNSIFAGNNGVATSPDVTGAVISRGNNIIGNVGTSTGWVAEDLQNMNPLLSPFGYYGGLGGTFAILSGSPALNAGQNCVTDLTCTEGNPPVAITADQRGASRPTDTTVDLGAFETSGAYTAILPAANLNLAYNRMIAPNNGIFTYSVTSGALPPGLDLTTAFAEMKFKAAPQAVVSITGIPTLEGVFNFAITVTNGTNSAVINYQLTVAGAAAAVPVGGRVFTSPGRGLYAASVTITDGASFTRTVRANQFGYYRFDGVPSLQTYTVSVSAKRHDYQPQVVNVTGAINDLNFSPLP